MLQKQRQRLDQQRPLRPPEQPKIQPLCERERQAILKRIAQELPEIRRANSEQLNRISTEDLTTLAQLIDYYIPLDYFPQQMRNLVDQITQPVQNNPSIDPDALIHQQQTASSQQRLQSDQVLSQTIASIEEQKDQNESMEIISTSVSRCSIEDDFKENKTAEVRHSYSTMMEFMDTFKKLPLSQQRMNVSEETLQNVAKINSWSKQHAFIQVYNLSFGKNATQTKKKNEKLEKKPSLMTINLSSKNSMMSEGSSCVIVVGEKQSEEAKSMRSLLRNRAQNNFKQMKDKQAEKLSVFQKVIMEMHYELNKVSPGNLDEIYKVIKPYITGEHDSTYNTSIQITIGLVSMILEKCETEHPRYIPTYATLSAMLSKIPKSDFKIEDSEVQKQISALSKGNNYKSLLVDRIQDQFHKKLQERNNSSDAKWIRGSFKRGVLGCIRLTAELIKERVLSKKVMNAAMASLLLTIMKLIKQQQFSKTPYFKTIQECYVDVYIEAFIVFFESLQPLIECMTSEITKESPTGTNKTIQEQVRIILEKQCPKYKEKDLYSSFCLLSQKEYIDLILLMNEKSCREVRQNTRIDLLLQNLVESRADEQQLMEIKEEGEEIEKKEIVYDPEHQMIYALAPVIRQTLESGHVQITRNSCIQTVRDMMLLGKKQTIPAFRCVLRLIADGRKEKVQRNVQNLKKAIHLLPDVKHWVGLFQKCWKKQFQYLSTQASDLKNLSGVMADLINLSIKIDAPKGNIKEYVVISDDQDEKDFMDEVLQQFYYHGRIN